MGGKVSCDAWTWNDGASKVRAMPIEQNECVLDARRIDGELEGRSRQSIVIELLHEDAQPPRRATQGSAGYDLCAYLTDRVIDCSDGAHQWKIAAESARTKRVASFFRPV